MTNTQIQQLDLISNLDLLELDLSLGLEHGLGHSPSFASGPENLSKYNLIAVSTRNKESLLHTTFKLQCTTEERFLLESHVVGHLVFTSFRVMPKRRFT